MARTYYLNHLEHNPDQQDIYRRHYLSPNSIISFDVRGGKAEAFCFLNALKLIKLAVSLGGTESLAEHPDHDPFQHHARRATRNKHHPANASPEHRREKPAGPDAKFEPSIWERGGSKENRVGNNVGANY